jgi:hypothetical protein
MKGYEEVDSNLTYDNIKVEREFRTAVFNWLENGEVKLFKSPTEGNYLVRIMNVSTTPNTTVSRMIYEFSATAYEVADCTFENFKEFNIIRTSKEFKGHENIVYKTINTADEIYNIPVVEEVVPAEEVIESVDKEIEFFSTNLLPDGMNALFLSFDAPIG